MVVSSSSIAELLDYAAPPRLEAEAPTTAEGPANAAQHPAEPTTAATSTAAHDAAEDVAQLVGHTQALLVGLVNDIGGRAEVGVDAADGSDQIHHGWHQNGGHVVREGIGVAADPGGLHFGHIALELIQNLAGELLLLAHAGHDVIDFTAQKL